MSKEKTFSCIYFSNPKVCNIAENSTSSNRLGLQYLFLDFLLNIEIIIFCNDIMHITPIQSIKSHFTTNNILKSTDVPCSIK